MTRLYTWLTLVARATETRSGSRFPRTLWPLSPKERELRFLRRELRRLEKDREFAGEWQAELAEGWRRIEFDRALLRALEERGDGGDPS